MTEDLPQPSWENNPREESEKAPVIPHSRCFCVSKPKQLWGMTGAFNLNHSWKKSQGKILKGPVISNTTLFCVSKIEVLEMTGKFRTLQTILKQISGKNPCHFQKLWVSLLKPKEVPGNDRNFLKIPRNLKATVISNTTLVFKF